MFEESAVFVITLGLAEVWFQKRQAGRKGQGGGEEEEKGEEEALWRAVPSDRFDRTRHGFRVSSVQVLYYTYSILTPYSILMCPRRLYDDFTTGYYDHAYHGFFRAPRRRTSKTFAQWWSSSRGMCRRRSWSSP